jgi:hypothetical protein
MANARRTTTHRRRRIARKPVVGALAVAGLLAGAWYATANGATTATDGLAVTHTTVSLPVKFPYKVVTARITGDIAVSANGALTWAYAPVTPSYTSALTGASPTTTTLRIARLKY